MLEVCSCMIADCMELAERDIANILGLGHRRGSEMVFLAKDLLDLRQISVLLHIQSFDEMAMVFPIRQ